MTTFKPETRGQSDTLSHQSLAPLFWVVMHDDPVTTMDFVVETLIKIYGYDFQKANDVMMAIHNNGLEKVALLPLERAEFKVEITHRSARSKGFPLTCTLEPD
ncbi:MAG: ATP-dependent Clp protease adaptor ClpS [Nitrospinae bacterium]|nr:ATP-dependent Clp protease adaptor ClpS [Nitrospinota bacterium]